MQRSLITLALSTLVLAGCPKEPQPLVLQTEAPMEMVPYASMQLTSVDKVGAMVHGRAVVSDVISDRGFWLGSGDERIFAVIREDEPRHNMIDIEVGDRLDLSALVMHSGAVDTLEGTLEADAKKAIAEQGRFLATHWRWVDVIEEGLDPEKASVAQTLSTEDELIRQSVSGWVLTQQDPHYVLLDFAAWDSDNSGELDRAEFPGGLMAKDDIAFEGFDADSDGSLSELELIVGMLDVLDRDGDGQATSDMFWVTLGDALPTYDAGDFVRWDLDGNGLLDGFELRKIIDETGLYDDWDYDGNGIDAANFTNALFGMFDTNNDTILTPTELRAGATIWYSEFEAESQPDSWTGSGPIMGRKQTSLSLDDLYATWDADKDSRVSESEWAAGLWSQWDIDRDERIEAWEWEVSWLDRDNRGQMTYWDTNDDGHVDPTEFEGRVAVLDMFGRWDRDADGLLDKGELLMTMFPNLSRADIEVSERRVVAH